MFQFKDILQQAQGLQQKMEDLQAKLADKVVVGSAGGDMVTVEATGSMEIVSIKIDPELLSGDDYELAQELITAAVNDALKKARDLATQEMGRFAGALGIPGLNM